MPAAYYWCPPVNTDFQATTAANWLMGPGTPTAVHTQAPDWDDDLYFQGDVTQAWCNIPQPAAPTNSAGVAYQSINLLFGDPLTPEPGPIGSPPPVPDPPTAYWGTVTLAGSFAVGILQVDCGYINQADTFTLGLATPNAGKLTVQSALDWTGGTLNSNGVAGFIDLAPGSISTAEPSFTNPGINGTVKLGSTLTLTGTDPESPLPGVGSTLSMIGGTFEVYNNSSIVAAAFSTLLIQAADKPTEPTAVKSITVDKKDLTPNDGVVNIKPKSVAIVDRPPNTPAGPAVFELKGKEAKFTNNGTTRIQGLMDVNLADPEATYTMLKNKLTPAEQDAGLFFATGKTQAGAVNAEVVAAVENPDYRIETPNIDHSPPAATKFKYIRIVSGEAKGQIAKIVKWEKDYVEVGTVWNTTSNLAYDKAGAVTKVHYNELLNLAAKREKKWFVRPKAGDKFILMEDSKLNEFGDPMAFSLREMLADPNFEAVNSTTQVAGQIDLARKLIKSVNPTIEFVSVPTLYLGLWKAGAPGPNDVEFSYAFNPGLGNLQIVNGKYFVPQPFAPKYANGKDLFEEEVKDKLGAADVVFVDDWSLYHLHNGEVHCGTLVWREVLPVDWWVNLK